MQDYKYRILKIPVGLEYKAVFFRYFLGGILVFLIIFHAFCFLIHSMLMLILL